VRRHRRCMSLGRAVLRRSALTGNVLENRATLSFDVGRWFGAWRIRRIHQPSLNPHPGQSSGRGLVSRSYAHRPHPAKTSEAVQSRQFPAVTRSSRSERRRGDYNLPTFNDFLTLLHECCMVAGSRKLRDNPPRPPETRVGTASSHCISALKSRLKTRHSESGVWRSFAAKG
jgi:hypothetical protein